MGERLPQGTPCAKGAICYCLDEFSKGGGARRRVRRLRDEVAALTPPFDRLTAVFDQFLLSRVMTDAQRRRAVGHLERHWFCDPNSPDAFFPGVPMASIYAQGVLRALDLALAGRRGRVVPLNAWWVFPYSKVKLLSLADVDNGVTIGGRVTLLILTPEPETRGGLAPAAILGETAQASVTEDRDGVGTIEVRDG